MSELKFYQKETVSIMLEVKNTSGSLADITGQDIRFRLGPKGRKFALEKSCVTDGYGLGIAVVKLNTNDTNLRPGDYDYEWRLFSEDGNVSTLCVGLLKIEKSLFEGA